MSLVLDAKKGIITEEMKEVARQEGLDPEVIRRGVAGGHIVIPVSPYRNVRLCGIGEGLRTKVNASIGTSSDLVDIDVEIEKARQAELAGADTLMELSTGGDLVEIRRRVVEATSLSVGSVPLYQAFIEAAVRDGAVVHMREDDLFRVTAEQAKAGTNFMAIHTGINYETMKRLKNQGRHGGLVSRGGAFMTAWMLHNEKENPLYAEFDYLCEIMLEHEVTLSMGNGMRAGAVHDATDRAAIQELLINAELADKAHEQGIQVIVEGPGHIPIDEIQANVILQKRVTNRKPFYMLGPLVTDIAPGYDDRVAMIGAVALVVVRRGLHLLRHPGRAPRASDPRGGLRGGHLEPDRRPRRGHGQARQARRRPRDGPRPPGPRLGAAVRARPEPRARPADPHLAEPADTDACTMCGDYCAIKIVSKHFAF